MIEIFFNEPIDAAYVYERLQKHLKKQSRPYFLRRHKINTILITFPQNTEDLIKSILVPTLVQFILLQKEDKWIQSILHTSFFYEEDEQNQIIPIAQSILRGTRRSIPNQKKIRRSKHLVSHAIAGYLKDGVSFSFDSFITFRLKEYYKQLAYVCEIAIDEYKLENEYQNLIENFRQQVLKTEALIPDVHIVYDGKFNVYDHLLLPISKDVLKEYGKFVENREYIDNELIVPLTAIAPKNIHLYTSTVDLALIVTLQNIFQERVLIHTLQEFSHEKLK
ncbi:sporulation protein YtxC [Gottfriedia luciferensis]|uniref:sporulation protein YtxC n=1 Tax=Gottfriedia luciferensis TaxID=178774 RepID=UPI000B4363B6|nr:sporulation protein YtxC [Gottfriedia luciferensis]